MNGCFYRANRTIRCQSFCTVAVDASERARASRVCIRLLFTISRNQQAIWKHAQAIKKKQHKIVHIFHRIRLPSKICLMCDLRNVEIHTAHRAVGKYASTKRMGMGNK